MLQEINCILSLSTKYENVPIFVRLTSPPSIFEHKLMSFWMIDLKSLTYGQLFFTLSLNSFGNSEFYVLSVYYQIYRWKKFSFFLMGYHKQKSNREMYSFSNITLYSSDCNVGNHCCWKSLRNLKRNITYSSFRNGDFDGLTRFWDPLNPKITFLANGLCVCVWVCLFSA